MNFIDTNSIIILSIDMPCFNYANLFKLLNILFFLLKTVLDASGKPPSGILDGTLTDFGAFEECLSIDTRLDQPDELNHFTGKRSFSKFNKIILKT